MNLLIFCFVYCQVIHVKNGTQNNIQNNAELTENIWRTMVRIKCIPLSTNIFIFNFLFFHVFNVFFFALFLEIYIHSLFGCLFFFLFQFLFFNILTWRQVRMYNLLRSFLFSAFVYVWRSCGNVCSIVYVVPFLVRLLFI